MSMTINEIKSAKKRLEADLSAAVEPILNAWLKETEVPVSGLSFDKNPILSFSHDPKCHLPTIARVELNPGL